MVVSTLLRRYSFVFDLKNKVLIFHSIQELYKEDADFQEFLQGYPMPTLTLSKKAFFLRRVRFAFQELP